MIDPLSSLSAALSDRYTIELEIGSGGMFTVYDAGDLKDQVFAIRESMPREVRLWASLHNPIANPTPRPR